MTTMNPNRQLEAEAAATAAAVMVQTRRRDEDPRQRAAAESWGTSTWGRRCDNIPVRHLVFGKLSLLMFDYDLYGMRVVSQ
jgi:hypothetical protein